MILSYIIYTDNPYRIIEMDTFIRIVVGETNLVERVE